MRENETIRTKNYVIFDINFREAAKKVIFWWPTKVKALPLRKKKL